MPGMGFPFRIAVFSAVAAVLCAATFFLVPYLRSRSGVSDGIEVAGDDAETGDEAESVSGMAGPDADSRAAGGGRVTQSSGSVPQSVADREQAKFEAAEMRNEVEAMIRRFRGTPQERQEVIDECEDGKEFIRLMAELSESSIEEMSPEELEKERESFEKDYRAQLDYLQTGRLQRMLKTPEEQEVIGTAIETVQDFLERMDAALHSAGY